jgi:hypothetical protein
MKRYRPLAYSFDARPAQLEPDGRENWEPHVQAVWLENERLVKESLIHEFGAAEYERKIADFRIHGTIPLSVVAHHNAIFKQARDAYVFGAYYAALAAAVTLGERILNHLVLELRESFRNTAEYKKVHRKKSFDNWRLMIDVLVAWEVLRPKCCKSLEDLERLRHRTVHFNPDTIEREREHCQEALRLLSDFIQIQFGVFGDHPWFIRSVPGVVFIKKEYETDPFIRTFYIPSCAYVGPAHRLTRDASERRWIVHDEQEYPDEEMNDEEYARLFVEAQKAGMRSR